jgi:hypothetical protein
MNKFYLQRAIVVKLSGGIIMIFKWFKKIFFNNKKKDESIERVIKELKIRAAWLAVSRETEAIRLKTRLTKA